MPGRTTERKQTHLHPDRVWWELLAELNPGLKTCHYCSKPIPPDAVRYNVNGVGPQVECRRCREKCH